MPPSAKDYQMVTKRLLKRQQSGAAGARVGRLQPGD